MGSEICNICEKEFSTASSTFVVDPKNSYVITCGSCIYNKFESLESELGHVKDLNDSKSEAIQKLEVELKKRDGLLRGAVTLIDGSYDYDSSWIVDGCNILIDESEPEYQRFKMFEEFLSKPEIKAILEGRGK